MKFLAHTVSILHHETASQYLKTTFELVELIEKLNPDLCVLDPLFDQGTDAVAHCHRKSVTLIPLEARYAAQEAQGAGILKLPP